MSIIISLFLIGISLSMDTFSVSLSIGTFGITKHKTMFFCSLVGILHFVMPVLGYFIGNKVVLFLKLNVDILLGIILLFIAIEMTINLFKEEEYNFKLALLNIMLISSSVSLDSFSTGLGLSAITNNYFLASFIFSVCATLFTFLGFLIGGYSSQKLGIFANVVGIILLFIISLIHII